MRHSKRIYILDAGELYAIPVTKWRKYLRGLSTLGKLRIKKLRSRLPITTEYDYGFLDMWNNYKKFLASNTYNFNVGTPEQFDPRDKKSAVAAFRKAEKLIREELKRIRSVK